MRLRLGYTAVTTHENKSKLSKIDTMHLKRLHEYLE